MPEGNRIRYTDWEDEQGSQKPCRKCFKQHHNFYYGVLKRRRVTGRDGESHIEYKVICPLCHQESSVHRTKLLAQASWDALQEPDDDALLRYRKRRPKNDGQTGKRADQNAWSRIATAGQKA